MRNVWRDVLDPIIPYETGTPPERLAAQLGLPELVRLSANENPLGPSPRVVAAIAREAARVHLYPDGGAHALREALARRLGVRPEQLVFGNGADELLGLLALAAFERGHEVVVPQPAFEPYATSVMSACARPTTSTGSVRSRRSPPSRTRSTGTSRDGSFSRSARSSRRG